MNQFQRFVQAIKKFFASFANPSKENSPAEGSPPEETSNPAPTTSEEVKEEEKTV